MKLFFKYLFFSVTTIVAAVIAALTAMIVVLAWVDHQEQKHSIEQLKEKL